MKVRPAPRSTQATLISRGRSVLAPSSQPRALRAARGVEVRHLPARVHAGIGAPGADELDGLIGDARERALERAPGRWRGRGCVCQPA